ncbi:hypothetical protein OVA14_03125 [Agrococcus sp. SL85]|uniref:hypothetical protein n=1 Tax=Agrococcus sp. SL85 TaxID=2995141 RepID=UPI00226CE578|nr:hypothetical protein [Agrococcus sp. SL85]WAC66780.1 hypothetical protein OVA14_03125 [Agrococcus sp. SL85]
MPEGPRGRPERQRLRALRELDAEQHRLRPAYKLWGYTNPFAKGWLLTRGSAEPPVDRWASTSVGPWRLLLDPELELRRADAGDVTVVILGQAFDDRGPQGRDRIARRLLRAATLPDASRSRQQVDEAVVWLSGRFVVIVRHGERLDVHGDPLASRSVYWHRGPDGVQLGSHSALLAEAVGGLPSAQARWALLHPDHAAPFGRWLPGLITEHDGVGQLFANGALAVDGASVEHRRCFPLSDRVELPVADAAEAFRAELAQQVRNWASIAPTTVLALTAGVDSRAVLEAGLIDLRRARALALTYHPFHQPAKSTRSDLEVASRLAAAAGLRHLTLDVRPLSADGPMHRLHARTFPVWRRYAALAGALYVGAPARAATIFGVGGAIVTGMTKERSDRTLSPGLLARKFAGSAFGDDPVLHEAMAAWMARTGFSEPAMRGHDFYDLFHWEHRMSKWAATGYAEYDLATIPAPVLSSRRLLLAALAVPEQARFDGAIYRAIGARG